MKFSRLFTDDEAVAPVIAVVLLVAITVVLAGVIVSFVMGVGSQTQQNTPKATFAFDYDENTSFSDADGELLVTHDGGDAISPDRLYVRGNFGSNTGVASAGAWEQYDATDSTVLEKTTSGSESRIVSGDRLEFRADSDYDLTLVYETRRSKASSTLASDEGPDA